MPAKRILERVKFLGEQTTKTFSSLVFGKRIMKRNVDYSFKAIPQMVQKEKRS